MKAKEYVVAFLKHQLADSRDKFLENASAEMITNLFNEQNELISKRGTKSSLALVGCVKEINQKYNAINRQLTTILGYQPFIENGWLISENENHEGKIQLMIDNENIYAKR